ncbi:natural cytotoxicity triggering receptor 3-like isoform X1 [Aquarana catesbeiana]|uniref:natural cytotoxicity triggering receptor 3-like isoform X1 n=1 Tax=Aquarana catesbeiana TaxID=8400 RepID=UPI003CC987F0
MGATMQHILRIIHPLLILTSSPGFLSQTIHVRQTPVIWATEGSSVTLPCDYRIIGESASIGENDTVGSYKWYKHMVGSKAEVSDSNINYSGRLFMVHSTTFIREQLAAMTLQPVELSDSGMYYCEVTLEMGQEIPGYGNGTFLNVTASVSRPPSYTVQNIIRITLSVLVFLAILFFLGTI